MRDPKTKYVESVTECINKWGGMPDKFAGGAGPDMEVTQTELGAVSTFTDLWSADTVEDTGPAHKAGVDSCEAYTYLRENLELSKSGKISGTKESDEEKNRKGRNSKKCKKCKKDCKKCLNCQSECAECLPYFKENYTEFLKNKKSSSSSLIWVLVIIGVLVVGGIWIYFHRHAGRRDYDLITDKNLECLDKSGHWQLRKSDGTCS